MDKKLLDALNNLSLAFEELAKALAAASGDKDKSATATALSQTKIEKKLELIDKGVKKIQADNKKILKNQEQLIKIAKSQKDKPTVAEDAAGKDKKSKIKDGLAVILLIAVGVLAIGLAFKLIGKVNFASVIAISLALPLLAFAFEKMAKSKSLNPARMKTVTKSLVIMSIAIVLSSFILSAVKPIGIIKLITAALIAAAFATISRSLPKMTSSFAKMSAVGFLKFMMFGPLVLIALSFAITYSSLILGMVKPVGLFKLITAALIAGVFAAISLGLPKLVRGFAKVGILGVGKFLLFGVGVLFTLSLAIAMSSRVLGLVKPVGIFKLFTAILISAAFGAIGMGIGKIVEGFGKAKISPQKAVIIAALIPVVFLALSLAIAGASRLFQLIKPVGLFKILSAALIGAAFVPLSYAIPPLMRAVDKVKNPAKVLLIPVVLVLLAVAIWLSSKLFLRTETIEPDKLVNIVKQAAVLTVLGFIMSKLLPMLSKVDPVKAGIGALVLIAIAGVIALASLILSYGKYEIYPTFNWIGAVTLSLTVFTLGALAIGTLVFGPQALVVLAGLAAILIISATIIAVAGILSLGKYDTPPPITWSAKTLITLMAFAVSGLAIGVMVFGMQGLVMAAGLGAMAVLSGVIVGISMILARGKYEAYPPLKWTAMVVGTLASFAASAIALGLLVFGPQAALFALGLATIAAVSGVIIGVAAILAQGKYDIFPSQNWTMGVVSAIGEIAWLSTKVALQALLIPIGLPFLGLIATAVKSVADTLSGGKYNIPGFVPWSIATVYLMSNFSSLIVSLAKVGLMSAVVSYFGGDNPFEKGKEMLKSVATTVKEVAEILSTGKYTGGPTQEWASSISIALGAFAPIYRMLNESKTLKLFGGSGVTPKEYTEAIKTVADGIKYAADQFKDFKQYGYPTKEWAEGVGISISTFSPVYAMLAKSKQVFFAGPTPEEFKTAIMVVSRGIVDAAEFFGQNKAKFSLDNVPSKKWGERVGAAISAFVPALDFISKNASIWTGVDTSIISKAIQSTVEGISSAAVTLENTKFGQVPAKDWTKNVGDAIKDYVYLNAFIYNRTEWLWDAMDSLEWTTYSMLKTADRFRIIGQKMSGLDPNWMKNVSENVKLYVGLAEWLSKSKAQNSTVERAVWGMSNLSKSYSDLATAIKKLNAELEELDVDKLNALRNLNASVVLMSLMDPKNFKEMMTEFEKKGGVLIEAFKNSEEGKKKKKEDKGMEQPKLKDGSGGASAAQRTLDDVCTILEKVEGRLELIQKSSGNISTFVDEIRSDNPFKKGR